MEIEIDKTVNHDACRAYEGSKGYRPIPMISPVPERCESSPVNTDQEPDHESEADDASLDQQLYVVVVSLVNKQVRVEAAVLGIHSWKRI